MKHAGPFGIPYGFMLGAKHWTVKWGDPTGDVFNSKSEWGCCVHADRLIVLHPSLRDDKVKAWEVFSHELTHALDGAARGKRGALTEANVDRLEKPLAKFLLENFEWKPK